MLPNSQALKLNKLYTPLVRLNTAQRLRRLREHCGWSIEEFSELLDISTESLRKYEVGRTKLPLEVVDALVLCTPGEFRAAVVEWLVMGTVSNQGLLPIEFTKRKVEYSNDIIRTGLRNLRVKLVGTRRGKIVPLGLCERTCKLQENGVNLCAWEYTKSLIRVGVAQGIGCYECWLLITGVTKEGVRYARLAG